MARNSAQPFTNELFAEVKRGAMKLRNQAEEVNSLEGYTKSELTKLRELVNKSYEDQLQHITEMVESKLKETTARLELQLAAEQDARLKAEEYAQMAQMKSNDEIRKLRKNLERAQREIEELRKQAESGRCIIL